MPGYCIGKNTDIPRVDEWWIKMMNFTEVDKVIILLREKSIKIFRNNWKPLIDSIQGEK